ncbi:MAG TPA: NADH-quinone oxidoreductase subunit M [Candidatus Methylacidiphilales bacterium]|jgi:NADH-quinone oxidoreductase subunit M|nr:NADH-quinone oxidoreductase subunit M [Candidatus Methylacidiphilales bacterium]
MSPLLALLLFPLAAILAIIIGRFPARPTAGVAAGINLVISLGLIWNYPAAQGGYAYVMDYPWVAIQGLPSIRFHLGADGISLPLIFLTGIVTLAAIAISPANIRRSSEYYCYLLLMSLGAMGAFTSLDLFFFFIFHDFALIATFLLIGIWGSQNRQYASFQVTIYLMTGSLVLLTGFVALVMALPPAERTFDIVALQNYITGHPLSGSTQDIIFLFMLIGFGILVGLFPFHSWAPPGYASAPPAAAMLHAGILKKFAIYGMIRIAIPMLHDGFNTCLPLILALLAGNFLYAGFVTIAQKELPTMIGFSSIMHMGYLFLGVACWNTIGVTGAVILMVGHGLSAALLFGLSGEITNRSGENRFIELGGLAKRAPVLAVLFSFASMASMGVPGLANFAGEIMVFFGSFSAVPTSSLVMLGIPGAFIFFGMIAIYGTVMTAIFQLRALKNVFYGPMPARYQPQTAELGAGGEATLPFPGMTDTSALVEHGPYVLLIFASLVIGFMPFLMIHLVEPSVTLLPFIKT